MHGIFVHARARCASPVYACTPRNHAPPTVASLALVSFLVSGRPLPAKRRRTSLRVPLAAFADRSVSQLYPTKHNFPWVASVQCSDLYLGCLSCMTRKCKVWLGTRREEGNNTNEDKQKPTQRGGRSDNGMKSEGKSEATRGEECQQEHKGTRRKLKEGREQCERRRNKPVP